MEGWIRLHRKMWENPIVTKDAEYIAVWMYLLSFAVYEDTDVDFKGKRRTLHPGQLTVGRKKLADRLRVKESKIYRIISALKSEHQIEIETSSKCSLITIVNWTSYQSSEQPNGQQMNNNRTTSEQQVNTNKEIKNIRNKEIYIKPLAQSVYELPLISGDMYPIMQDDIDKYKALYPAANVDQEFRNMIGWCDGNPTKRKTARGIKRFINSWLSKAQDRPRRTDSKQNNFHNFAERHDDYGDAMAEFNKMMG